MLAHHSIATKILAVVGVMAAGSIVIGGVATVALRDSLAVVERVDDSGREALNAADLRRRVLNLNRLEFGVAANPLVVDRTTVALDAETKETLAAWKALADGGNETAKTVLPLLDEYIKTLWDKLGTAQAAAYDPTVRDQLVDQILASASLVEQIEAAAVSLSETTSEAARAMRGTALDTGRRIQIIVGLAALLSILGGVAFAMTIARFGIVKPLRANILPLRQLLAGETEVVIPDAARRDEIGEITAATLAFRDSQIQRLSLEAEAAERARAESERARRLRALAEEFRGKTESVLDSVTASASAMEEAARVMTSSAETTNDTSTQTLSAADQVAAAVTSVAAAAEQMAATVQEVVRQMERQRSISDNARVAGERTMERMNDLKGMVTGIADITGLIREIAARTNLLALNASIEAARAGEQGKGFAVVANEVKTLATRTAGATSDIGHRISSIDGLAGESHGDVSSMRGMTAAIHEAWTGIAAAVEQQSYATNEISARMAEAARNSDTVTASMAIVAGEAGRTSEEARKVFSAATDLAGHAQYLQREITTFLRGVAAA